MDIALWFAAVGAPGSFWDSPSNVSGVVVLGFGLAAIVLSFGLAKVFKRFNGVSWMVLGAGVAISAYGIWRMGG
ncbi:MAG: hypothetical protein K0S73_2434 [Stenotrophomonas rhizophila]|jgi:hypothetical protein|uniref:Uncharacterized protein n=1 Tax=Stenotrophomonas rhizophila TaxID=216778 RepID=A0AAP5AJE9_9GAMM|nr:hypothetical protein [Stenotrophomonas rhizophila]MDF2818494.1 hypothetical protein [Stenotrophomonas rhizophila]MDQ1109087.1 hypothetical protein [Stenotrophomonas rhizophila]